MTKFHGLAIGALLIGLSGCAGSDDRPAPSSATPTEGDVGITDAPTSTESAAVATPETSVVVCELENGLPVADVKVTNTTDQANVFSVEVQFMDGDTVLGSGLEFTQELQPGHNQTISMGNMQGDAEAVATCKVTEAVAVDE
jgi:hypothetical protein